VARRQKDDTVTHPFIHDVPHQRVVFGAGTIEQAGEEAERLGMARALVVATPGSGARLGQRVVGILGVRAAGLCADAVIHVPAAVAAKGLAAARAAQADGLIAVGGGSAIGLAKAIAHETGLPILALPTTYSGSEGTVIFGMSEGDRKLVRRDPSVRPRTVIYDPDLTLGLPAAVTAASGMNAMAHCVEGLWVPERTPASMAVASEALRLFVPQLPRAVADGNDRSARGDCLAAAWLSSGAMSGGTGLHHKLVHVLGGFGLPHAETHSLVLPHVARFNLAQAGEARERLTAAFGGRDPVETLAAMVRDFPIPKRLGEVGFSRDKFDSTADLVAAVAIREPRPVTREDVLQILDAAF
jgi:maleylacetate reductase